MDIQKAAHALWGDYRGNDKDSQVLGVGVDKDYTIIEVWVKGEGPSIPNPWMGFPIRIHKVDTSI